MTMTIAIDEKACVGCALCADICPTKVFEFDESKELPQVKNELECFGCLSCSEICPATAIAHKGISLSQCFYHDPQTLEFARKLGQDDAAINAPINNETLIAHAEEDLGIRLLSVAAVLKQTLGQSLLAIGTQAGRSLSGQLPRYQEPASLEESLQLTKDIFAPAWDLDFIVNDKTLTLVVKTCFVREVCHKKSIALGGDLCTLFYGYIAGYLARVAKIRPRLTETKPDAEACTYTIQIHAASA